MIGYLIALGCTVYLYFGWFYAEGRIITARRKFGIAIPTRSADIAGEALARVIVAILWPGYFLIQLAYWAAKL
jgi:hypothetical protein